VQALINTDGTVPPHSSWAAVHARWRMVHRDVGTVILFLCVFELLNDLSGFHRLLYKQC